MTPRMVLVKSGSTLRSCSGLSTSWKAKLGHHVSTRTLFRGVCSWDGLGQYTQQILLLYFTVLQWAFAEISACVSSNTLFPVAVGTMGFCYSVVPCGSHICHQVFHSRLRILWEVV